VALLSQIVQGGRERSVGADARLRGESGRNALPFFWRLARLAEDRRVRPAFSRAGCSRRQRIASPSVLLSSAGAR
jgi:hypothetical protein